MSVLLRIPFRVVLAGAVALFVANDARGQTHPPARFLDLESATISNVVVDPTFGGENAEAFDEIANEINGDDRISSTAVTDQPELTARPIKVAIAPDPEKVPQLDAPPERARDIYRSSIAEIHIRLTGNSQTLSKFQFAKTLDSSVSRKTPGESVSTLRKRWLLSRSLRSRVDVVASAQAKQRQRARQKIRIADAPFIPSGTFQR